MKLLNQKGLIPVIVVLAVSVVVGAAFLASQQIAKSKPTSMVAGSLMVSSPTPIPTPSPSPSLNPSPSPLPSIKPLPSLLPSVAPSVVPAPPPPVNNTPPGAGFSNQNVSVEGQTYPVAIIAADLNSTKVIVDTASESDCGNNCPVLSLAEYVSRNGAYAGINGSYFCPADYASCSGKSNSF
ncbi:MAG: hypothetical protein NUV73_00765, partial [Candidatus Daviesbacteria bacterium]|nr:hypothetical protein [Candidatus Daviesbacteria bacterium]